MSNVFYLPLLLMQCSSYFCNFAFPNIKLEAYAPRGFRASIPETDGVTMFAFHGNRNRNLSLLEPGEFNMDIINPKVNGWFYFNPNLKLDIGDKVYYWMFIQHENIGYRRDTQVWDITELLPLHGSINSSCVNSETEVLGLAQICQKQLLLNDDIEESTWKRAHFIASKPDYPFCSYQKINNTLNIKDNTLIIQPIPFTMDADVRGTLDLRNGCTSHTETDCIMHQDGGFILPPVISERMKTTRAFKYGKVEITAKLPVGDWLYPEIYLQSSLTPSKKIWIAYARGNERLIGNGGDDLGGTLLFGGPILNVSEPDRSKYLSSYKAQTVFGRDYHTYTVIWEPRKISLLLDNVPYGESDASIAPLFNDPMHVVLGVGVGGVTDFPDNYVSTNNKKKPWVNFERLQMKKFFNARDDWLPTWTSDGSCLKIKHLKVWAL